MSAVWPRPICTRTSPRIAPAGAAGCRVTRSRSAGSRGWSRPARTRRGSRRGELEPDHAGEDDVGHRADLLQRGRRHRIIEVQDRHGAAAAAFAAELHAGDVDVVATAEGADAADDTGNVLVGED